MVYAPSEGEFGRRKGLLHRVLYKEQHKPFHYYMKRRWYSMKKQWADHKRGKILSAGNTTSNRLESHWKHLKAGLRQRRRMDSCYQATLMRGQAVLSRERDELVEYVGKTRVLVGVHKFVHSLLRCLSSSRVTLVRRQWEKYSSHPNWYKGCITTGAADHGDVYKVSLITQPGVEYVVSCPVASKWSGTCRFATTHELACRHQLYVGLKHQTLSEFPVSALYSRWNMSVAAPLVDELNTTIDHLATVRIPVPGVDVPRYCPPSKGTAELTEMKTTLPPRPKAVSHVRVRGNKRSEALVLNALQKRNHIRGQLERVMLPMMELSTPRFWAFSEKLEAILTEFTASLATSPLIVADGEPPSADGEPPSADGESPSAHGESPSAGSESRTGDGESPTADTDAFDEPAPTGRQHPQSASIQPVEGVEGELSKEDQSLHPAILANLLDDEELERDDDGAPTYSLADGDEEDVEEDDDPDEEDFRDIADVVAQHEALRYDQLDLCSLLDTVRSSLHDTGSSVFHDFAFDSPEISSVDPPPSALSEYAG